jgi:hypothetical protein
MSNLYREPAIDASYKVSVHLALPQTILVSDWLISKKIVSSETVWPNESKLGRKHPWKVHTEPPIGVSHQVLVIWLNSHKEEDI